MLDLNEAAQSVIGKPLPKARYSVRCIGQEFKLSSKQNPMIVLDWEIVWPDKVKLADGSTADPRASMFKTFLTLTSKALGFVKDFHKAAGLPPTIADENNPDLSIYADLVMECILSAQDQPIAGAATPEQVAAGQRTGDPIIGLDGKPVTRTNIKHDMWLGLTPSDVLENIQPN